MLIAIIIDAISLLEMGGIIKDILFLSVRRVRCRFRLVGRRSQPSTQQRHSQARLFHTGNYPNHQAYNYWNTMIQEIAHVLFPALTSLTLQGNLLSSVKGLPTVHMPHIQKVCELHLNTTAIMQTATYSKTGSGWNRAASGNCKYCACISHSHGKGSELIRVALPPAGSFSGNVM
jgi:hypothetical protein